VSEAMEFVKKHKVLVGVGAAGLVLLYLLQSRSSGGASASGAVNPLQVAQLQASQNLQMAQLQAQQNTATLGAQVQQNQTNEALQAEQDQLAAQVAATAFQFNAQNNQTSAQEAIYKDLIDTGAQEQQAQYTLAGQEMSLTDTLAGQIVNTTNKAGHSGLQETGANELALLLGQGNIGSYNSANASEQIASSIETGQILSGLTKGAATVAGGLF
jgi:hypothetical protein